MAAPLHCGLHAVNALLHRTRRSPYTAASLDAITRRLDRHVRALCAESRDLEPETCGNYPVDTLFVALKRRGLQASYVRRIPALRDRRTLGYLIGTGDHYLAVTRSERCDAWELWDNTGIPPRSPSSIAEWNAYFAHSPIFKSFQWQNRTFRTKVKHLNRMANGVEPQ